MQKLVIATPGPGKYREHMSRGFGMTPPGTISAEPLVKDEKAHRNKWVAVHRGDVLVEADTEPHLIEKIKAKGLKRGTYVVRYIGEPSSGFIVGVG